MSGARIRRLAGITCAAIVASLPIPMWIATRAMLATPSAHSASGWTAIVVAYAFSAILPVFYFALSREGSRDAGTPRLPERFRAVSLAGAIAGGIVIAAGVPEWLEVSSFDLTALRMLLSDLANFACTLLLVAFYRGPGGVPETDVPPSDLLRGITRVAVFAGGIWFIFNLLGLALTPYPSSRRCGM